VRPRGSTSGFLDFPVRIRFQMLGSHSPSTAAPVTRCFARSVTAVTDATGYAELYVRGSVDARGGPDCCSVNMTIVGSGYTMWTGTLDWLSPDMNGDGIVDALDVGILLGDFGTSACRSDFNCDGVVGEADLDILEAHYRHSCTGQLIRWRRRRVAYPCHIAQPELSQPLQPHDRDQVLRRGAR
jgi:hypothetical protein